jgi:hypothetical protein
VKRGRFIKILLKINNKNGKYKIKKKLDRTLKKMMVKLDIL